jgi:hypothetical protein
MISGSQSTFRPRPSFEVRIEYRAETRGYAGRQETQQANRQTSKPETQTQLYGSITSIVHPRNRFVEYGDKALLDETVCLVRRRKNHPQKQSAMLGESESHPRYRGFEVQQENNIGSGLAMGMTIAINERKGDNRIHPEE